MKLLFCALFCAHLMFANAQIHGFAIRFVSNTSFEEKKTIILKSGYFEPLSETADITEINIIYAELKNTCSSEKEANTIQHQLHQFNKVKFANPVYVNKQGYFAGVLGEFYVLAKSKTDVKRLQLATQETNTHFIGEDEFMRGLYILESDKNSIGNAMEMAKYFKKELGFSLTSHNSFYSLAATSLNDTYYDRLWAIENSGSVQQFSGTPDADMDVDSAWTITTGDSTIKVVIMDSGVDTLHPDLLDNLLPGFDAYSDTSQNTQGYPTPNFSEDGHGTCCAGIVAAAGNNGIGTAGIAYNCKIIPARIFFYTNITGPVMALGTTASGTRAINWAYQVANADVLSNSWGIPENMMASFPAGLIDTVLGNAVLDSAYLFGRGGKGIISLFSAGNENTPVSIWPANHPNTISVAATSMCDERKNPSDCSPENWWGSSYGANLDISAPGVKIMAPDMLGANGFSSTEYYASFNGTSAACPNAAGVMALMLSINPNLTATQARSLISTTCEKVGGYQYDSTMTYGNWSMDLGYGRVNAFDAVQAAQNFTSNPEGELINSQIRVFPNPSKGIFQLNISDFRFKNAEVFIYNLLGKQIKKSTISTSSFEINISNQPKGIYFICVKKGEEMHSRKIIKL